MVAISHLLSWMLLQVSSSSAGKDGSRPRYKTPAAEAFCRFMYSGCSSSSGLGLNFTACRQLYATDPPPRLGTTGAGYTQRAAPPAHGTVRWPRDREPKADRGWGSGRRRVNPPLTRSGLGEGAAGAYLIFCIIQQIEKKAA